jgi:hypothetical protein
MRPPAVHYAKGTRDADVLFLPAAAFKLVFLRMHFSGGSGTANVTLTLESAAGDEWNTLLYTVNARGVGADLNLILTREELSDPSPWAFQPGDGLRIQWANPQPDTMAWALELGYEPEA